MLSSPICRARREISTCDSRQFGGSAHFRCGLRGKSRSQEGLSSAGCQRGANWRAFATAGNDRMLDTD